MDKYRQLVENLDAVLYTLDLKEKFTFITPNIERIAGYRPEEVIGRQFTDFVHPEDQLNRIESFQGILKGEESTAEYRYVIKNGSPVWVRANSRPIVQNGKVAGAQGILFYMTNDESCKQDPGESRSIYHTLFERNPNPIAIIDTKAQFIDANKAFIDFVETGKSLLFEKKVFDYSPPGQKARIKARHRKIWKTGGTIEMEFLVSGRIKTLEITITPITYKGTGAVFGVGKDITRRKQAEEKSQQCEQKFRALFDNYSDAIILSDMDGRILEVNEGACNLTGYTREEFLSAQVGDFISGGHEGAVEGSIKEVLERGRMVFDSVHKRKDGTAFPIEVSARKVEYDGRHCFLGVARDITERKQAEQALRQSEEKYRTVLESMEEGYFETDLAGNFTFYNDAMCRIMGYPKDELMKMNYKHYMSEQTAGDIFEIYNFVYRTGDPYKGSDLELIRKDGSSCYVDTSVSLKRNSEGKPVGFQGVARDVTERKKAEYEKEKLQAQLRQSQKMEAIGTLAGGIAHDFNNIVYSVIGWTELCLEETEEGTLLRQNLSQVLAAGNRASDLVRQILRMSKQEEQEFVPTPIVPLVRESLKMLRIIFPATIGIEENILAKQAIVHADPTQLHQVIVNLATNARDAMGDESGVLEVCLEPVNFDKTINKKYPDMAPGDYIHMAVSDTGCGIPDKDLNKIFEPYFTTKQKETGTGLGLSIVHGIVKGHKGHISVYSEPGKGTCFHVYLPLAEQSQPASKPGKDKSLPGGTEHILLVDDEKSIVQMQQRILEGLGYRVTPKTCSTEALKAFRECPDKFDILLTDMTMPNMTGDKLAIEVKQIRPGLPVVLTTGFSEKVNRHGKEDLEVDGFLMKPVTKREIAEKVRQVIDEKGM